MNKSGKIIAAFAIGSAAGAFLGMLLSSDGKKRARLVEKADGKLFSGDIREDFLKEKTKAKKGEGNFQTSTVN